jgi:hypothetical protein
MISMSWLGMRRGDRVLCRQSISLEKQDQSINVVQQTIYTNLGEQFVHLATIAIFCFAMLAVVFIAQEVVPEEWVVNQTL